MDYNHSNFSAHIISNSDGLDCLRKNKIHEIAGCNQAIKEISEDRLFIIIPDSFVENICKLVKRTLDEILNEFSIFSFSYTVHRTESNRNYNFSDEGVYNLKDSTIIEINHTDRKIRYYAFCMIRHLYYYQEVLENYFSCYNKDDSEKLKVLKLSASVHKVSDSIHTYIPPKINVPVNCADILSYFIEYGGNSTAKYSCGLYNNFSTFGYSMTSLIEAYKNRYIQYVDRFGINENFVIVDKETFDSIPNEIINSKVNDYALCSGFYKKMCGSSVRGYILNVKEEYLKYFSKNNNVGVYNHNLIEPRRNDCVDGYNLIYYNTQTGTNEVLSRYSDLVDKFVTFDAKAYQNDKFSDKPEVFVDIRSRHPSHDVFRRRFKSRKNVLIRLGSTRIYKKKYDLEINSIEAIENSSNKHRMKTLFTKNGVITATWVDNPHYIIDNDQFDFPIIAKNIYGSRGTGNYKIDSKEEFIEWVKSRGERISNYIFERFMNYNKEYRVHVSKNGVFLIWRKLRRLDTPSNQKWFFNNQNCNWVGETNPMFDAPNNIEEIKEECIKALNAVGLDIGACDVRVGNNQDSKGRSRKPPFVIIEINSAPSMAERTAEAYINEFNKLIN